MVVNFRIGFEGLEHSGKKYCLFLSDTVHIGDEGPKLLTPAKKGVKDVTYNIAVWDKKN